ncbi:MAG TPA: hypothetical protein VLB44_07435 [Kofleriaceae bacterium]|nr:hypothetical protein [Kofleriaceae bacterium]
MRISLLIALLALGCESKSDHKISKQMDITDMRDGKTQTCVEGDEATCTRVGGRWSNSVAQCCLPKASCAFGDESACARAKGTWTGKYCCLAADSKFVPGDEANCANLGGAWTGMQCLVK